MRVECPNEHRFDNLRQARQLIAARRSDFIDRLRHTNLVGLTSVEYANRSEEDPNLNRANLNQRTLWGAGQNEKSTFLTRGPRHLVIRGGVRGELQRPGPLCMIARPG